MLVTRQPVACGQWIIHIRNSREDGGIVNIQTAVDAVPPRDNLQGRAEQLVRQSSWLSSTRCTCPIYPSMEPGRQQRAFST